MQASPNSRNPMKCEFLAATTTEKNRPEHGFFNSAPSRPEMNEFARLRLNKAEAPTIFQND
jgi:hypothetical protein